MSATSTAARRSTSRTARSEQARSQQASLDKSGATSTGRTTTGDNGGGRKPKPAPKSQAPKEQPKPKPATLGQSGYRAKFGLSDKQMLAAIKSYAKANYDKGGWDVLVEAWDDEKILSEIGWATKLDGALKKLRPLVAMVSEAAAH